MLTKEIYLEKYMFDKKVQSIIEDIQTYQKNWKEQVERMQDNRLPKLVFKYKSVKKRNGELKNTGLISLIN